MDTEMKPKYPSKDKVQECEVDQFVGQSTKPVKLSRTVELFVSRCIFVNERVFSLCVKLILRILYELHVWIAFLDLWNIYSTQHKQHEGVTLLTIY